VLSWLETTSSAKKDEVIGLLSLVILIVSPNYKIWQKKPGQPPTELKCQLNQRLGKLKVYLYTANVIHNSPYEYQIAILITKIIQVFDLKKDTVEYIFPYDANIRVDRMTLYEDCILATRLHITY
jgi:hypothetical protein